MWSCPGRARNIPVPTLARAVDREALQWCQATFASDLDPLPQRDTILSSRSRAAAWVVRLLSSGIAAETWAALKDNQPDLLNALWETIFGVATLRAHTNRLVFVPRPYDILVLSPSDVQFLSIPNSKQRERFLPNPGPDWTVSYPERTRWRP
jgi:hypothetical protein